MRVYRTLKATSEVEKLATKHRDAWDAVEQFERLLSNGLTHGHERYPSLRLDRHGQPASVWKARVICQSLGGKRSGLRYVYERVAVGSEEVAIALTVYVHQSGAKESNIRETIRKRSLSFDATPDALKKLDKL